MKRLIYALIGGIMAIVGLTACGNQPVAYTPAAAAFGGNGYCYMPLSVPQTAWQGIEQQYIHQHWCQAGWQPMYIPQSTYMTYYPYYSSGAFYNTYIPASYRGSYVSYERSYGASHRSQISTLSKSATYKGTNGKTTTYNQIKSGGGTRGSFGSGTRCSAMRDALMKPQYVHRGGGGGGFSGGGSRGGSSGGGSRSGTSGGSRSGSGTRSGC